MTLSVDRREGRRIVVSEVDKRYSVGLIQHNLLMYRRVDGRILGNCKE